MEDRRNAGESSCNFGDGTDRRVQSLMMMMMMMMSFGGVIFCWSEIENSHIFFSMTMYYSHNLYVVLHYVEEQLKMHLNFMLNGNVA